MQFGHRDCDLEMMWAEITDFGVGWGRPVCVRWTEGEGGVN